MTRKKTQYKNTHVPTFIEADCNRIRNASSDSIRLAKIIFPHSGSCLQRAGFLAIMYELRNAKNQRMSHTEMNTIHETYGLSQSQVCKVRAKMKRIGLIHKYEGEWAFSNRFENSMRELSKSLSAMRAPAEDQSERRSEKLMVESAKTEPIYKQMRKIRDDED